RADRDADRVVRAEGAERAHDRALAEKPVEDDAGVFPGLDVDEVGDWRRRNGEAETLARLSEPGPFPRGLSSPARDLGLVPDAGPGGVLRRLVDVERVPHLGDRLDDLGRPRPGAAP